MIKPPKCKNCGKPESEHKARTHQCPLGRKHRVMGYTCFANVVFEPVVRVAAHATGEKP